MTDKLVEVILEMAAEVRNGAAVETIIPEFAADYGVKAEVLSARFARAYPNGVPAAAPSADEMIRRRREEADKIARRNHEEAQAILDFFAANPRIKQEVRRNIYRYTGKQSCNLATAKAIADKLAAK